MYCTECGVTLDDNAKFCSSCGVRTKFREEVTTAEISLNQIDDEVKGQIEIAIKESEKDNFRKLQGYVVALLLIWFVAFHNLGLGITYTDLAGMDCELDTSGDPWIDDLTEDLSRTCSEMKKEATGIVFFAFALAIFWVWLAHNPPKKDDFGEDLDELFGKMEGPEKKKDVQREVLLTPLEKNKKELLKIQRGMLLTILVIIALPIFFFYEIHDDDYYIAEYPPKDGEVVDTQLSILDAMNEENCLNSNSFPGVGLSLLNWELELQDHCEGLAKQATSLFFITTTAVLFLVFLSFKYLHVLGNKKIGSLEEE